MNRRTFLSSSVAGGAAAGSLGRARTAHARSGGRLQRPVDIARTAHLVIDLQNGFVEAGAPVEVPAARGIIPNVNAISRAMRAAGGANVFVQFTLGTADLGSWSNWFARFPESARAQAGRFLERGSHFHQLWPALDVQSVDLRAEKSRFSAFIEGASDLHQRLQARNCDTLIITGTLTNVCCESSARDAMQLNYRTIFIEDATAAQSDEAHRAAIANMRDFFGEVTTTAQILDAVKRADK